MLKKEPPISVALTFSVSLTHDVAAVMSHPQVLPERTHPHMMMHAAAGYVLSGTTTLRDTPGKAASSTRAAVAPTPKRSATAVDASSVPESSEAKRAKIDGV
jgi:hypothetical protein